MFVTVECLFKAIRRLMQVSADVTAQSVLIDFFALKAKQTELDASSAIASTGENSVETELNTYFRLVTDNEPGIVNPFGRSEGRLSWLSSGYSRSGTYTHLYRERALTRNGLVDVEYEGARPVKVGVRADTASAIAKLLRGRLPLEPTAAFLLRREPFSGETKRDALLQRFRDRFHLTPTEVHALFESDVAFELEFGPNFFDSKLESVPVDIRPIELPTVPTATPLTPSEPSEQLATLHLPPEVNRRLRYALMTSAAVALVGPPGTGKTTLVKKIIAEAADRPEFFGLEQPPEAATHAAEADWSARSIIGGHYPTPDGKLEFRDGAFLSAVRQNKWLVIDEMNRADLDRSMGPLMTFLSGHQVDLGLTELTAQGKPMVLRWTSERYCAVVDTQESREYRVGADWRLIGTYNSVDLGRVFSMGAALSRRWATVPVPAPPKDQMASIVQTSLPMAPAALAQSIGQIYAVQADLLPLGPAPYLDIARYAIVALSRVPEDQQAAVLQDLIGDGYVLYIKPQLRRLAPEARTQLIASLAPAVGTALAAELAVD